MNFQLLFHADCREAVRSLGDASVASIVCDPPYDLTSGGSSRGFMGKEWDGTGVAFDPATWREMFRVLSPGGHLLAFGGTRTYHRLAVAVEDAGFELRDCLMWLYGKGYPKSNNSLKPAYEPVVVARKPLIGTVAENVAAYGTGSLNIDGCRVGFQSDGDRASAKPQGRPTSKDKHVGAEPDAGNNEARVEFTPKDNSAGRWPANVLHDGSETVIAAFRQNETDNTSRFYNALPIEDEDRVPFFYCNKASRSERDSGAANRHPTVKPISVMRWCTRLVTPPGGVVLDPFMGSGTTGIAAVKERLNFIGIEREAEYLAIAEARIRHHGRNPEVV